MTGVTEPVVTRTADPVWVTGAGGEMWKVVVLEVAGTTLPRSGALAVMELTVTLLLAKAAGALRLNPAPAAARVHTKDCRLADVIFAQCLKMNPGEEDETSRR